MKSWKLSLFTMVSTLAAAVTCAVLIASATADKSATEPEQELIKPKNIVTLSASTETADLPGMEKVAETNALVLFFNKETTEVAVLDKRDGMLWYSNPPNREEDAIAQTLNKGRLGSQIEITYYNPKGQANIFDNFNDSIINKQFKTEKIENGIKIIYEMGDFSKGIDSIPKRISKERFETLILSKIDEATGKKIIKNFKFLEEEQVYERWDTTLDSVLPLKRMLKVLEDVGYTEEDLAFDNEANGMTSDEQEEKARFTIPIEYSLDGDSFLAKINANEIQQSTKNVLQSIKFLENFGAADQSEEGYIFVPDGSGALIYLNNNKLTSQPYKLPVYGRDNAVELKEAPQFNETTRLPVFGLKKDDHAVVGVIEQGAALANIEADISGRVNSYNRVYSSYTLNSMDTLVLSNGSQAQTIPIFQTRIYQDDLVVRYGFLSGEAADYSGMARYYRKYLVDKYNMQKLEPESDIPFYLELAGAINKRKSFLGIPYDSTVSLTSFSQARQIVEELKKLQIDHVKLRLVGWFNGGINHSIPDRIRPDSVLGGKKEFEALAYYLHENGIDYYPDVSFLTVYKDTWRFSPRQDASRKIDRKPAKKYTYNPATFLRKLGEPDHYILSPNRLPTVVDQFLHAYKPYGINGLSLRDLGDEMNSDFRESKLIDREQSNQILEQQMKKLKEEIQDPLVIGGNATVLPYTRNVLNAPMSSSGFNITDESVPFYQMVIHGYIDYAGTHFNLAELRNKKQYVLKQIETGSNPYFQWIYEEASSLKETEFDSMYSAHYKDWITGAKAIYDEVNEALKDVRAQSIISHDKLAEGVFRTTYENGKSIIVNYTDHEVKVDGITLAGEDYFVGGE